MTKSPCHVIAKAMRVQADIDHLANSMRRLRNALNACETCPDQNCPLIMELSTAISTALMELSEEWSL
jgi:hypothetical protein